MMDHNFYWPEVKKRIDKMFAEAFAEFGKEWVDCCDDKSCDLCGGKSGYLKRIPVDDPTERDV